MSQWNNTYAYNNQYQAWNGDPNVQYVNQGYYPNRADQPNQYVSFNEFLSQMQNNAAPSTSNYSNVQYENYPPGQYNYQNIPTTAPQNPQLENYGYAAQTSNVPSGSESYPMNMQSQYAPAANNPNVYTNAMILKSNLTPTATEFVPKSSMMKPSVSSQNIPESSTVRDDNESRNNYSNVNETRNQFNNSNGSRNTYPSTSEPRSVGGSSSDTNWRERPQSTQQVNEPSHKTESYQRTQEPSRNQESTSRHRDNNYRNNESNARHHDTSSRNQEGNSRSHEANSRNQEGNGRNQEGNGRNHEVESRQYESSNRQQDSNSRTYEATNRNYENTSNKRGQTKSNYKSKSKDDARTFYNSSISKDSQDVRNGRGESSGRGKNWVGTPRLRAMERNSTEDEQYANTYLQGREDRVERDNRDRDHSNRERDVREPNRDVRDKDRGDVRVRDRDRERNVRERDRDRGERDVADKDKERDIRDRDREHRELEREHRHRERENREKEREHREKERDNRERERAIKSEHIPSPARSKARFFYDQANKEMTQRERLTEQLDKGTLECLVCCERVKQYDPVWSCSNCYHVLHLRCIRKWAMSSMVESKWRCPACQNTNETIPTDYRCMCGAVRTPEFQRGAVVAHTCGRSCRRPRSCPHPCTLLCHPGPCPPCQATVMKSCGCGAENRSVLCSSKLPQVCGRVCGRTLECGVHKCTQSCHDGPCETCTEMVEQVCYCPAAKARSVACTAECGGAVLWSCGEACGRVLACGAHVCRAPCHAPPCQPCALLPQYVTTCPCGNTKLAKDSRKSCTEPIPLCGNICAKPLSCGPAGDKHFCKINCHEGPCPECPDKTVLQCRCGHSSREVPCVDLPQMYNNVFCQKKCNKKLSCGRHRCRTVCCAATSHRCAVVCGRTLACQAHRCEDFCHTGHCAPCPRLIFEELSCACGAEVLFPPVRCGTRAPACAAPCGRPRGCPHPPHHSCHSGDCPPCVVLTTKRCHGNHEERKTIPCSQEEFSCGLPCGKPLPCGKHTCIKTCHKGPCDTGKCTQPCTEKRPSCGHPCAAPCHAGGGDPTPCPSAAPCRRLVRATCPCSRRHAERTCADNARDYAKMMSALAATKMAEGGTVDVSEVQRPSNMLKTLECDDECRVEARTRQLALALQIRNPDVSAKLAPRYSDHVRTTAAREPAFANQVHDKLTELVQLAKKSKQKTRAHSFPSMNRQKRQFIHEMCEHFGCESVAYDAEPNRNVVATADKEKSWLPAMSVMEVLAREAGKRRVPGPVLRAPPAALGSSGPTAGPSQTTNSAPNKSSSGWATLTSTNAWAARSQPKQPSQPQPPAEKIDYFDNPPDN
ncbi:protein shuttle craft [Spodoptera litura]|uniref:Protein shuttle craft n=1 Tax=Spodoptera litura TaxID=69820 RepID=A0A9J7ELH0_SPOLT|nr:protein shuttle craft [Spodoptera litura]